jgi:integrase
VALRVAEAMSADDCLRLLAVADTTPLATLVRIALHTGMRRGELLGLRWADVDWDAGRLYIQQTAQRLPGGVTFRQPKTPGSRRPINLGATEVARLRQHRRTQVAHRLAAGPAYQDHDLVFASSVGTAMEPTTLDRIWRRIVADAGVGHVTFHGLRHAMASLLLTQNVHPKVVSERLGHSNVNVTMTIYSHVMPTLQADAAAMLDALLAPSAPADADIV